MASEALSAVAERLRRLRLVTDPALAHLELDELVDAVVDRTRAVLDVDTAGILLLDPERDELLARAVLEPPAAEVALSLEAPLVVRGAEVGVLQVGSFAAREFRDDEVELLQLVADRVAIAIEHAQLIAAERRARERLERVQTVTDAALAYLDLEELLAALLDRTVDVLDVDTAAILLLDETRGELVARAAVGIEEEVEQGVRIPIGRGFAGRIAAERRPIFLPDVDHADVLNPLLREKGIKSMLGVPLLARDEVIGVLHVGSLTPREFGDDETDLLQLVADRVALAIQKARVHRETVELDQLKTNFVAIASHELRTPATVVCGVLKTLYERGDELSEETRSELLRNASEQGDRLGRLLEQLLDLSRLDARAIAVEPEPLVLHEVIADVVADVGAAGENVRVQVPQGLAVVADRLVLERVLTNLLANALRYGEPPVVVSAEQRDQQLRISVEDRGEGVPDELQERLFDRFERGSIAGGSGLGLAIARAYARAHDGEVVYAPEGRGARFELILPRS